MLEGDDDWKLEVFTLRQVRCRLARLPDAWY